MGFILTILAHLLFTIVFVINFPIVLITHAKKRGFFRVTNEYWFNSALDLDIFGNYTYRATWNALLQKDGYLFGRVGETISSALGKNQKNKTLTAAGWLIVYTLWLIDFKYWFKGGHCINSIIDIN